MSAKRNRYRSLLHLGLFGLSILGCNSLFGKLHIIEADFRGAHRIKAETKKELSAGRRLALLIANSNYHGEAKLNTPREDIKVVGSRLSELGFGITIKYDLGGMQLRKALAKFTEDLTLNDEVYFHYAGHGLELDDGEPMLLGIDFAAHEAEDAKYQGYKVSSIVSSLSGVGRAVVIVDACRNNPFTETPSLSRSLSQSSEASRGLPSSLSLSPKLKGGGVFVVFSTTRGKPAMDGEGISPFVRAFDNAIDDMGYIGVGDFFSGRVQPLLQKTGQELMTQTFGAFSAFQLRRPDSSCPKACRPSCTADCLQMVKEKTDAEARVQAEQEKRRAAEEKVERLSEQRRQLALKARGDEAKAAGYVLGNRRAFLIANSAYSQDSKLKTPERDIQVLATKLQSLGYQVESAINLTGDQLRHRIGEFYESLSPDDEVYFHYTGFGLEIDREPLILGTDFSARTKREAEIEGYSVDTIVTGLHRAKWSVVVIDACRNNPFYRAIYRGLPSLKETLKTSSGVLLLFTTASGGVAIDGEDLSPFVEAFSRVIDQYANVPIFDFMTQYVQREFDQITNGSQAFDTRIFGSWSSAYTFDGRPR